MGQGARVRRRDWLALSAAALTTGCERRPEAPVVAANWIGASHERGHRLRELRGGALPAAGTQRRTGVLVIGGGIAALAAARALRQAGIEDFALLELEDAPGGNSRGHAMAGLACPLGAHYLPLPGTAAHEVSEWLHEIGLLRSDAQGRGVADERYLCHSPQERLFYDGAWHDGLLPPAEAGSGTLAQYRAFDAKVDAMGRALGFTIPTAQTPWTAGHAALDAISFA
ncbi:MAG: NAD(P)-binding protein, partial [Burkholderiales bacterium]|nr:NAD(P)-binding protein [Burkholderiales bacterium]